MVLYGRERKREWRCGRGSNLSRELRGSFAAGDATFLNITWGCIDPEQIIASEGSQDAGIFGRVCIHERLDLDLIHGTMSLATTAPRKQAARPAKPAARYWKGKAPQGITDVQSDSDEDDEEQRDDLEEGDVALDEEMNMDDEDDQGMTLRNQEVAKTKAMNIALKDVAVSKEGKVIVSGRDEVGRTALEQRKSSSR